MPDHKAQDNDLKEPFFLPQGNLRQHPQFYLLTEYASGDANAE
jgi:hypothetical protein